MIDHALSMKKCSIAMFNLLAHSINASQEQA